MSVLVNSDTKLLVQGITGGAGSFHARLMREYGTNIVAGVTPGRGGQNFDDEVPVFNTVAEARDCPLQRGATFGPLLKETFIGRLIIARQPVEPRPKRGFVHRCCGGLAFCVDTDALDF